ncbi:hypothetical protein EB796_023671 [Bugula neritina]|uniref:DNA primase large subunit n=1 Tax=Bugula neritina TaxID=10212 RepID=A0A7J7IXT9_BUGNE|nr:hypothetical protein EB796_023671 [Bugula neritina]
MNECFADEIACINKKVFGFPVVSSYVVLISFVIFVVLKAIELNNVLKGKKFKEYCEMRDEFRNLGWQFLCTDRLSKEDEEKDLVSHHILRLAYAKSEGKRQWFITQETELLKLRMMFSNSLLNRLLEVNQLSSNQVPAEEINELTDELRGCQTGFNMANAVYYKVDFEEVLQLVSSRKVYLSQGYAYLPASELQSFVLNKYKIHLKEQLAMACKLMPGLEEENRIMRQLKALSGGDLGTGYTTKAVGDKITCDMLDQLSLRSYPLCMQTLHNHIKVKHHAKHEGRMQYGLFLKGMGVSLEESLKYWRTQFCKGGIDTEKFDKTYAYNVRHNYGKEGKRADYSPFSCLKIISSSEPKGDECHGCTYKHSDELSLRHLLEKRKISAEATEEILGLKRQGHYQVACMSLFKATHPKEGLHGGLQHPNQYFEESQTILSGNSETSDSKMTAESSEKETAGKSNDNKENIQDIEDEFDDEM